MKVTWTTSSRCGAGGHERTLPLNEEVVHVLRQYRLARGGAKANEPFFRSREGAALSRNAIYERVRTHARQAHIPKRVSPHRLRHTFATHLVQEGVGLVTLRDLLGTAAVNRQLLRHDDGLPLAFNLDGNDDWVSVNPVPILNFTEGVDFSIEGWINPLSASTDYGVQMIADKRDTTASDDGAVGYALYLVYGQLGCQITEGPLVSGHYHAYGPAGADLRNATTNHHVAMTIHRNSASGGKLYVDGLEVLSFPTTNFNGDLSSGSALRVGKHATSWVNAPFKGLIDELSIYNRALSQAEVQSIYSAGADGKALPPTITTQPQSQTVPVGANVTFTVAATGTAPLSYQWRFNTVNISGATGTSYTRNNVQPADAGNYSVVVNNPGGSTTSVDAILTVTGGGGCTLVPSGLVSWWRAEGDAVDASCLNPGTLMNGATFGAGEVGQGFSLNGASRYVRVPSSASLRLTQELTLECWYKDSGATVWYGLIAKRIANSPETTSYGINILPTGPNQVVQFYFRPAGANWQICSVPSVPAPNLFHHIAGTFRQTDSTHVEAKLFIDGSPVKTSTLIGNLADCQNDAPVTIGASYESGEYVVGVIDEASIYNRALSETEIHNLYTAGAAGKCPDSDGDSLPDAWEIRYFGNLLQTPGADVDGDGLSNHEEYQFGYDPTNAHTGGSLLADGEKDYDSDGLSNLSELRHYHSDPTDFDTFAPGFSDGIYFHAAPVQLSGEPPAQTKAKGLRVIDGDMLNVIISEADAGARYDLYYTTDLASWQWRCIYRDIVCDDNGDATFTIKNPGDPIAFFYILSAEDSDGDGLTDGYEIWFRYNGQTSSKDLPDSDRDFLKDGWEVEYGLNPMKPYPDYDPNDPDGGEGNHDDDALNNRTEHDNYYAAPAEFDGSYDPLRPAFSINKPDVRAVVTVSASAANTSSQTASFTISRSGGDFSQLLIVYYSVGGTLAYVTDYTLDPQPYTTEVSDQDYPDGYPRVFLARILPTQQSVTVTVTLQPNVISQRVKTFEMALTPYSASRKGPVVDPEDWGYVIDWNHNWASIGFALGWDGITFENDRLKDSWQARPPDPHGAAGRFGIIQTVNRRIHYYNKDGSFRWAVPLGLENGFPLENGFFEIQSGDKFMADPKAIYDPDSRRFFVIMEVNWRRTPYYTGSLFSVCNLAVSKTNDPQTPTSSDWYFYKILMTETHAVSGATHYYGGDYPGLGVDHNALYITYNMFDLLNFNPEPSPSGTKALNCEILVLEKALLINGTFKDSNTQQQQDIRIAFTPVNSTDAAGSPVKQDNGFSLQPATPVGGYPTESDGSTPVAYFAEVPDLGFNNVDSTHVRIWRLSNPLGLPKVPAVTFLPQAPKVALANGANTGGGQGPTTGASQSGGPPIATVEGNRCINAIWHTNYVWFCTTAGGMDVNQNGTPKAYWFRAKVSSFPPTEVVAGSIDPGPGVWTFYPTLGARPNGDMCIVFGQSSAASYPSIGYVWALASDSVDPAPPEKWFRPPEILKSSSTGMASSDNPQRWGDFATVTVDPTDSTFWISHEYVFSSADNFWGTWWRNISFP